MTGNLWRFLLDRTICKHVAEAEAENEANWRVQCCSSSDDHHTVPYWCNCTELRAWLLWVTGHSLQKCSLFYSGPAMYASFCPSVQYWATSGPCWCSWQDISSGCISSCIMGKESCPSSSNPTDTYLNLTWWLRPFIYFSIVLFFAGACYGGICYWFELAVLLSLK